MLRSNLLSAGACALALSACANAPLEEVGYGVFRM